MSNAALAAYRKVRAVEPALTGASYDQIAGELGYANRGTAWRAVQSGLKERRFAAVDDYREAELHRLDNLERRLERRLAEGDLDALMSLHEDDAGFPTPQGTSTGATRSGPLSRRTSIPVPR